MGSIVSNEADALLHSRQPLILIVDDNDDNLLLLHYVLEDLGYRTVGASCGKDAIALAAKHTPNLVLLDILLPDMNGMTVISHLRRQPKMRRVPIIAVTALARTVEKSKIISAGFNAYIAKPYMIDELHTLISRYIKLDHTKTDRSDAGNSRSKDNRAAS
ncbi:MAG: response regulator [Cyanobacteria bacterium P01_H01_bin.21]